MLLHALALLVLPLASGVNDDWKDRVNALNAFYCEDDSLPKLLLPLLGNGYLSNGDGVRSDAMYVSGVFNGETTSPSHRARIPATFAVTVTSELYTTGSLSDIEYGTYARRGVLDETGSFYELRWYAHRSLRHLYVMELDVSLAPDVSNVTLTMKNHPGASSEDISFENFHQTDGMVLSCGSTLIPETSDTSTHEVCVAYTPVPEQITVTSAESGKTKTFITAIYSSLEEDHGYLPESMHKKTLSLVRNGLALSRDGQLLSMHKDAWAGLWQQGISISGCREDVALAVNASLYAILSSVRADWPYGLAPGGLTNYYNGHSFWDTETWMYPPLLMLHPDIARCLIQYRFDRLDGAKTKALSYDPPFAGAMFPWESAYTGVETCPTWAATGLREQHISADIAIATWQYWLLQRDEEWLKSTGNPIIQGIAEFLASKVSVNDDVTVAHINDVIPPDEYVDNVNDSVFTNYGAKLALSIALNSGGIVGGLDVNDAAYYEQLFSAIVMLFNDSLGVHPEYDGYSGDVVKQADVVLLHYPLGMEMSPEVQRADLDYYSERTDVNGPAMTWGMHAIGYRDLMDLDEASSFLNRSFADNMNAPFNVWTESPKAQGALNFVTGAGGFLQTVLSGYIGVRVQEDGDLTFSPLCMAGSSGAAVRGISYLGAKLDLSCECGDSNFAAFPTMVRILLTSSGGDPIRLSSTVSGQPDIELVVGKEYVFSLVASDAASSKNPEIFTFSPASDPAK